MLVFFLVLANACEKEKNDEAIAEFKAGSLFYKQDDNTYFKLQYDSLFKYTPAGKVFIEHTIDADMNLSSSELNVSGMISVSGMTSNNLFPDKDQRIICLLKYPVLFQVTGKADGIVIYQGDTASWGYSNKYEDYPFAQGKGLDLYNENQTDETEYKYWYSGTFVATMVARNFGYIDEDYKELTKTITVEILDPETVTFLD